MNRNRDINPRLKRIIITSILIGILIVETVHSQWTQTDGPYTPINISWITSYEDQIFAGTGCGLHTKMLDESKWRLLDTRDNSKYSLKGDTLFYGYRGIYLRDLSNPNLEPISLGDPGPIDALKPTDTCLFVGINEEGFIKSGGFSKYSPTWIYHNEGLPFIEHQIPEPGGGTYKTWHVYSIETVDTMIYCGTHQGIYKSSVNDISWTSTNNGLPEKSVRIISVIEDTIYAGIGNQLFYSSNFGETWNEFFSAQSTISSFLKTNGIIYVSTLGDGIYTSTDYGETWDSLNSGLATLSINHIHLIDSILICGSDSQGVYYFLDNKWENINKGIICSRIFYIATNDKAIIANDLYDVYSSTNGYSWDKISPEIKRDWAGSVESMGDTIFISISDKEASLLEERRFILYTDNYGANWQNLKNPVPRVPDGDSYSLYSNGTGLFISYDFLYYTEDLGQTYVDLSFPQQYCEWVTSIIVHQSTPFALTCGKSELLKLDQNQSWILSNSGLPTDMRGYKLAKTNDAIFAGVEYYGNNNTYVSKDSGQSWLLTNYGLHTEHEMRSSINFDNTLFVTTKNGVLYTDDYGQNWHSINNGLINRDVWSIGILHDTLYVGTYGNGIWKRAVHEIPQSISTKQHSQLHVQYFPNPAIDYIQILNGPPGIYNIRIFDLTGKQVLSKRSDSISKIDVSKLNNGIYIILLESNQRFYADKISIQK